MKRRTPLLACSLLLTLACAPESSNEATEPKAQALIGIPAAPLRLVAQLAPEHVVESPLRSSPRPRDDSLPRVLLLDEMPWRAFDFPDPNDPGGPSARAGRDRKQTHGPGASFTLSSPTPRNANIALEPIHVEAQSTYTLVGWRCWEDVVVEPGAWGALVLIEELDDQGEATWHRSSFRQGSGAWERFEMEVETGPRARRLIVHAALGAVGRASGRVWFDDLALLDAPREAAESIDRALAQAHREPWAFSADARDLGSDDGWNHETTFFQTKAELGAIARNALRAPVPTEFAFPIDLDSPAFLDVDLGVHLLDQLPPGGAVQFDISLMIPGQAPRLLLRESLDATSQRGWQHRRVQLEPTPVPARLVLRTSGADAAANAPALWGNPTIRSSRPAEANRHRLVLVSLESEIPGDSQLAEWLDGGSQFTHVAASSPNALPAFASALTGRSLSTHHLLGRSDARLDVSIQTLAESLQAAGHDTGAFLAGPSAIEHAGLAQGFDTWERHADAGRAIDALHAFLSAHAESPSFALLRVRDHIAAAALLDRLDADGLLDETLVAVHTAPRSVASLDSAHPRSTISLLGSAVPEGRSVEEPVGDVDLVPTLLSWADVTAPSDLDGRSLLATLHENRRAERPLIALSLEGEQQAISVLWAGKRYTLEASTGAEHLRDGIEPGARLLPVAKLGAAALTPYRAIAREHLRRLPGLHVLLSEDDPTTTYRGSLRLSGGRRPSTRAFFGATPADVSYDDSTGITSFEVQPGVGVAWLNLSGLPEDTRVELQLRRGEEALHRSRLHTDSDTVVSLSAGRFRFLAQELGDEPELSDLRASPGAHLWFVPRGLRSPAGSVTSWLGAER